MSSMMMSQQQPSSNGINGHYSKQKRFQSPPRGNLTAKNTNDITSSKSNSVSMNVNTTGSMKSAGSISVNGKGAHLTPIQRSHNANHHTPSPFSSAKGTKKLFSYETLAPRSQNQRNRLAKLQFLTSGPIGPTSSFSSTSNTKSHSMSPVLASTSTSASTSASTKTSSIFEKAMIPEQQQQNLQQPHSMPNVSTSKSDQNLITATLQTAHQTSQHVSHILKTSSQLSQTLSQTISLTQSLSSKHSSLLQHSSELSYNAEKLQSEYDILINHANDIGLPLKHYDDIDRLGLMVGVLFKNGVIVKGIARVKVDDDAEFTNVLDCINEAILFFERRTAANASNLDSSSSSGSMEYYKRAIVLQESSLDLLKEAIMNRINTTTIQIINALQLNNSKNAIRGDVLEASMIYTRFHGISSRSCHLMNMIYKRMNSVYIPDPNASSNRRKKNKKSVSNNDTAPAVNRDDNSNTHNNEINRKNQDLTCPYTELWTLCRNSYIANRTQLLKLSIRNHLDFLKDKHGLIGMTRLASVFLMRLCTIETSLYLDFFGKEDDDDGIIGVGADQKNGEEKTDADGTGNQMIIPTSNGATHSKARHKDLLKPPTKTLSSSSIGSKSKQKHRDAASLASQVMSKDGTYYDNEFQTYLDSLCDNLHRTIRRGLVSVLDLDTLCQIVSVLREERSLANSSPTTMAAARSIGRVIVDAQERLIFCTNSVLSKEVIRFKATPMDLDYPNRLRKLKEDEINSNGSKKELKEEEVMLLQMQVYESWFPPIRSVLKVLSKIFRVVEPNVFEDIALTSIQACSRNLKEGSMYIEKKSGVLHSDLFLVKNLLILREQLSPFDIQLRSVERQLDFSDAGKAVSRFIANRNRRLFSMTAGNALVTLLSEGVSTRETSIDSKRDLEDALRSACNDFIEHTSVSLAGPVLTFVEQCKSVNSAGVSATTATVLSSQSFMTGEYVKSIMTRALDRSEPELGEINTQMALYMDSVATRSILLKPVIRKITRLLEECRTFIEIGAVIDETERWTKRSKDEVFKIMDNYEKLIKSASPRV